ncbi:MAG: glutamate--cysteine ligase [Micrococcaceae bacterium]
MALEFQKSKPSTLGVEWELALVDPKTGDLLQTADDIIKSVNSKATKDQTVVENELMLNTIEIATGVCDTVDEAMKDLASTVGRILPVAKKDNTRLAAFGLHPTARPEEQEITDLNRYQKILRDVQVWARHLMIWGIHVHVGVDSKDKVVPIMNGLMTYSPQFIALSASSPYWHGADSGYASNRTMLFQQFPTAGIPPQIYGWEDYAVCMQGMQDAGIIEAPNDLRWDIRPAPHFGTVEIRLCDGMADLKEIAAITALAQCLVDEMSEQLDNGYEPIILPQWFLRENKWRAARYGIDAKMCIDGRGTERPIKDEILDTADRLKERAEKLGCADELAYIKTMVKKGPAYKRQLEMREKGADFSEIVLDNADNLEASLKNFS